MDVGTGISIGIPAGCAVFAGIVKAWPRSKNNKEVTNELCLARVSEIKATVKGLDDTVKSMHRELSDNLRELKERIEKIR